MFRTDPLNKKLKLSTIVPHEIKTLDILNQLVSAEQKLPFAILERAAEAHFYSCTQYGILQKSKTSPTQVDFKLFIYQKPTKSDLDDHKMTVKIIVDDKGEIHTENNYALQELILLKIDKAGQRTVFDFQQSIAKKEMIPHVEKNPYFHQHFIFLSLMSDEKAAKCYQVFARELPKIKKQFGETKPYTINFFPLNSPAFLEQELELRLQQSNLRAQLQEGSVYLMIQGHCHSGADALYAELPLVDSIAWKLHIAQLVEIIQKFAIPRDALFDIEVYACSPGRSSDDPSFCMQLNNHLNKYFTNLRVKGTIEPAFSVPELVLSDSPQTSVTFGVRREIFTDIEQVVSSESYYRIMHYPLLAKPLASRNEVIAALQKYAEDLVGNNQDAKQCESVHAELTSHLKNFELLDHGIQQGIKNFEKLISKKKLSAHAADIIRSAFLKSIEETYRATVVDFNFKEAHILFANKYLGFEQRIEMIWKVNHLKKYMQLHPTLFGKTMDNKFIAATVMRAEKGEINFKNAWDQILDHYEVSEEKEKISHKRKLA